MMCSLCLKHKKQNTFTKECKNFRTSTLLRQSDSADHKEAVVADSMSGSFEEIKGKKAICYQI
jgi:hypothetical protein